MADEAEVTSTPERWGIRKSRPVPYHGPPPQLRGSIADRIEADLKASGIEPPPEDDGVGVGTSLMAQLADELKKSPLEATAQHLSDLRFQDMMELCTSAISKNPEKLKGEPYDLAIGLSTWAIETLAKRKAAS
jgi:hypothetical protein